MNVDRALDAWGWLEVASVGAAFVASVAFALVYQLLAPWWRSREGRNLMALAVCLAALCATVFAPLAWPEVWPYWVLRAVRAGLLLGVAVVMGERTRMVWRAQMRRRNGGGA